MRKPVALIFARFAFDDFELLLFLFLAVLVDADADVPRSASSTIFEPVAPVEPLTVTEIFVFIAVGGTWW